MAWLEELAIAEFFGAAGGGAIIADDPRCFPFTHALSPAPLRGGHASKRLVLRWPGGGGWVETSRSVDEVIGLSTAPPILFDLSGGAEDPSDLALSAATLVRKRPDAEPPAGFCAGPDALPGIFVRKDDEARKLWERISTALVASTLTPAVLYDRLQAFVGGRGLVRDILLTEPAGPVAALDPTGCIDRLAVGEASALLCATERRWSGSKSVRLSVPRFGNAPFRLRLAGLTRSGEPPRAATAGQADPVPVNGRGWAFAVVHDPAPAQRCLDVQLVGEGVLVTEVSICLPPLAAGWMPTPDHYDPLSVYARGWWHG